MVASIKTIAALFVAAIIVLATSAATNAQTVYWQFNVSTPTYEQQTSTFNLDYNILSTEQTDAYKVELIANGSVLETQNPSTTKFGLTGRFVRSDVPEGIYTYTVKATRTADNSTQETAPRTVQVNLPEAQVILVPATVAPTTEEGTTATPATTSAGTEGGTTAPEEEATATPTTQTASATTDTDVQGASTRARNFTIAGLLLVALVGGTIWYVISSRLNKKDV